MFGMSSKLKYTAVDNDIDETVEFEPMRRQICSPSCLKSSIFTSILIGTYYIPSIGLTFYQRWLYQSFHFPLFTVIVHMVVKYLLALSIRTILSRKHRKDLSQVLWKDYLVAMIPTGVFSGIDIGFSNWGLELVTVSLYTMTKSTTIVFILFFSILFKLERKSWSLAFIVLMISLGLILFTYKSTQFNVTGFVLLMVASMSSGIRWTCVQMLLQKSKMGMKNPVDMIYHMQPFMIASVVPFAFWIEGSSILKSQLFKSEDSSLIVTLCLKILLGAFIAFFMEFSEVTLVTYTSSLTLSIAGIFKEVVLLVLAIFVTGDVMSPLKIVGLLICLIGITSHVVHKIKTTPSRQMARLYDFESEHHELGEGLMEEQEEFPFSDEGEVNSEDEKSDSQILFDILNRHDK